MKDIYRITLNEMKRIISDKFLLVLSVIIPLLSVVFFGFIYQHEIVREVPIAIYDNDNTDLSRKLIKLLDASPSLIVTSILKDQSAIDMNLKNRNVFAVIFISKNFESEIKSGSNGKVTLFKNSENILVNNILHEALVTTIKTLSGGIMFKKLKSDHQTSGQAMFYASPIKIESHLLFNKNYSYEYYLTPGFVLFTLQLSLLLVSATSINTDNDLIKILASKNINAAKIMVGKLFGIFIINLFVGLIILYVIFPYFNINYTQTFYTQLLYIILFILTTSVFGIFFSSLIKDKLFCTEILVFISTPTFIFSGYTFPVDSMPYIHRAIAATMPFTHILNLYVKIFQMNLNLKYCNTELIFLLLFIVIFISLTIFLLNSKLKKIAD